MGRLVLGIVGAVIGAYFGGPAGAQAGFAIGSAIGSVVGPKPKTEGPRMGDVRVQDSTYGAVIPSAYGTYRLAGQVIWADDIIEHAETTEQGGKGGGVEMTTYSYTCSFAIGICEGPIDGIRRIWADGKLYYDTGSLSKFQAGSLTVYLGGEDQMPDPTIEAVVGAGLTPAHRGMAYIVFADLELQKFGNRIPQLSVEVVRGGANFHSELPTYLGPISETATWDAVNADIDRKTGWVWTMDGDSWAYDYVSVTVTSDNPEVGTVATFQVKKLRSTNALKLIVGDGSVFIVFDRFPNTGFGQRMAWVQRIFPGVANADGSVKEMPALIDLTYYGQPTVYAKKRYNPVTDTYDVYAVEPVEIELVDTGVDYIVKSIQPQIGWEIVTPPGPIDPSTAAFIGGRMWIGYSFTNATMAHFSRHTSPTSFSEKHLTTVIGSPSILLGGTKWVGCACFGGPSANPNFVVFNQLTMEPTLYQFNLSPSGYTGAFLYDEKREVFVNVSGERHLRVLDPATGVITDYTPVIPVQENEIDGRPSSKFDSISYSSVLDRYIIGGDAEGFGSDGLYGYTTLHIMNPDTFEIERYFMYEQGGGMMLPPLLEARVDTAGRVYMISFDTDNVKRMYLGTMDGVMPLWKIVRDISLKCGLTDGQIDVSALQDEVMGYAVTNVMSGRSAIEPLTAAFMFDAVDSDGKVKFVKRGQLPVLSIDSSETLQEDNK